jgi:hypothetical protein
MSESEKNVNPSKELKDGELEKVAGGTRPGYTPSTHNVYAWAWTECKQCGEKFQFKYNWHWGLVNHGAENTPELCPKCDPLSSEESVDYDRGP